MDNVLIVSNSLKSIDYLKDSLVDVEVLNMDLAFSAYEARNLFELKRYDLFIINSPLVDEFGEKLAVDIASNAISATSQIVFITKNNDGLDFEKLFYNYEIVTLFKPISKVTLQNVFNVTCVANKKLLKLNDKNKELIQKFEDIKVINRAKYILISQFSMSEAEAHKYIEKQAMDMRKTKKKIADDILKTYDY